jgi:hypothetical protein
MARSSTRAAQSARTAPAKLPPPTSASTSGPARTTPPSSVLFTIRRGLSTEVRTTAANIDVILLNALLSGNLWYTSEKREREMIAAQEALQDAARRRASLLELGGKKVVATNAQSYTQQPQQQPEAPSTSKSFRKWTAPTSSSSSSAVPDARSQSEQQSAPVPVQPVSTAADEPAVSAIEVAPSDVKIDIPTSLSEESLPIIARTEFTESSDEESLIDSLTAELQQTDALYGTLSTQSIALAERLGTDLKRKKLYLASQIFYKIVLERRQESLGETNLETIDGEPTLHKLVTAFRPSLLI